MPYKIKPGGKNPPNQSMSHLELKLLQMHLLFLVCMPAVRTLHAEGISVLAAVATQTFPVAWGPGGWLPTSCREPSPSPAIPGLQPGEAQATGRLGKAAPGCSGCRTAPDPPGGDAAAPWNFGNQKPPLTVLVQTPATKKLTDLRRQAQLARRHFLMCS